MISASLAQIGEFSFILAELGVGLNLLPEEGRDLILAGAILSIVLNPLIFAAVERLKLSLEKRDTTPQPAEAEPLGPATELGALASSPPPAPSRKIDENGPVATKLTGHTILVGYGRVGSLVGQSLKAQSLPFLVIEDADKTIARLQADGIEIVTGNAANAEVFAAANAVGAQRLILAIPNAFEAGQVVLRARAANPGIDIIARAHSDAEVEHLTGLGANTVIMGEREIARGIVEEVLGGRPQPPLPGDQPDAPKPSEPPVS